MNKYGTALSFLDDLRTYIEGSEMDEKWIQLKKKSSLLRMLIYKNKGDLNLALKSAKHVMAFIEKYDKAQSIYEMAMTREFIAELYFLLDDNAEAMANIQLALSFYREIELTQYTSLQLADALIFASQIYKCLLENENSEAFLNEAYVIYSNKYGDKHPVIGYITLQISEIYRDKANYPKAISYGKKAIKILRCYYHDEDNNIIEGVKNLSHIYKEAEDINQSIKLLKETIDRIDKNKMIDDLCSLADIIYNLGLCYMETNDYPNARKYLSEALEIYNSNLAEDDLVLNDIIQKITMVNFEMTKNNSNSTLEHSLYPKKTVFKNYEDGNLVNSHINLADMLMMKGEFEQSLKLYLSALKIKKDSNYTDIKLNDILMKIGLINLIAGKFDESLKYFQDCLRFQIETTYNQMTEHIMRLNLIISHLYVILDLKPQAQEYNEKTCKILTHLRSSSQTQNLDTLLANHAQQFIGIDLNKDKILDKNEVLNDLLEILQIAFHYENSPLTKIDAAQKLSLISSIHQTQGEMFSRKNIDLSTQNLSNEQQPVMIRKMNSMMGESSRNFGLNMKSPKSFTSSHKGNSLGHSGSTPRFRGDSMIFKKRSYICLLGVPGEKNGENGEYFFQEKNSGNIEQNFNSKTHGLIKQEKSFNITTSNNKQQKRNTLLDNNKIVKLEEEISDDSTFLEKQKKNKVSVNII